MFHLPQHGKMNVVKSLAVIFGCLFAGDWLVQSLHITLPGSIAGLLLLTLLLKIGIVKVQWLEATAQMLIKYMSFFFIPPGVALMCYLGLIRTEWLPIVVSCVVSILCVLLATAWTYKLFARKRHKI